MKPFVSTNLASVPQQFAFIRNEHSTVIAFRVTASVNAHVERFIVLSVYIQDAFIMFFFSPSPVL